MTKNLTPADPFPITSGMLKHRVIFCGAYSAPTISIHPIFKFVKGYFKNFAGLFIMIYM